MASAPDPSDLRPLITYPCPWVYQVIGRVETTLRVAIGQVLPAERCAIRPGNTSRTGKYVSLHVEIEVRSEVERTAFFEGLRGHPDTVMVF